MIQHRFVSQKADGSDATLVKASNWNDIHVGTVDVLSLSVYACTGNVSLPMGPSGCCVVLVSATGGFSGSQSNLTLPAAASVIAAPGQGINKLTSYVVKIINTGDNGTIVVLPSGNDLINRRYISYELPNFAQYVELISDGGSTYGGTGWWITDSN